MNEFSKRQELGWKHGFFYFFVMPFIVGVLVVLIAFPLLWGLDVLLYRTQFGKDIRESFGDTFPAGSYEDSGEACIPYGDCY